MLGGEVRLEALLSISLCHHQKLELAQLIGLWREGSKREREGGRGRPTQQARNIRGGRSGCPNPRGRPQTAAPNT